MQELFLYLGKLQFILTPLCIFTSVIFSSEIIDGFGRANRCTKCLTGSVPLPSGLD